MIFFMSGKIAHQSVAGPSTASTSTASSSSTLAARRWKMFGRLTRGPKFPNKRAESTSSSESDDGSEDSSSVEEAEENGAEYEMDSKDLCIEIKAKEKDSKNKANPERLQTPQSGRSPSPCRDESPVQVGDLLKDGVGVGNDARGTQGADKKPVAPENSWMKWDDDRTTRANQDCQRELESTAVRELIKYFGKRKVSYVGKSRCFFPYNVFRYLLSLRQRQYQLFPDHLPTTLDCSTKVPVPIRCLVPGEAEEEEEEPRCRPSSSKAGGRPTRTLRAAPSCAWSRTGGRRTWPTCSTAD